MSRRVLITGAAGFLGEHLGPALLRAGDAVRLLDRTAPPEWVAAAGLEHVEGDVRDVATVARALDGVDTVVHAAFASPRAPASLIRTVNEGGTGILVAAARRAGVRRFVLVSSTIVRMRPRGHPVWPRSPVGRLDLYRRTRIAAEQLAASQAGPGFVVSIVRPATFLGPGRVAAFALLFEMIRRGVAVPVFGSGRARYQLLDVRDLADALCRLVHHEGGGMFELGSREVATVRAELEALIAHAGTGARLRSLPSRLARAVLRVLELAGVAPLSEWHQHTARERDWVLDVGPAERELAWVPRSNRQVLSDAYDWYAGRCSASGAALTTNAIPRAHRALCRLAAPLGSRR